MFGGILLGGRFVVWLKRSGTRCGEKLEKMKPGESVFDGALVATAMFSFRTEKLVSRLFALVCI